MSEQPGNSFLYLADALSSEEYLVHATTEVAEQIKMAVSVLKQAQETVFEDTTGSKYDYKYVPMANNTKSEGIKDGSEIFKVEKGRVEVSHERDTLGNPIQRVTIIPSIDSDIIKSYRHPHLILLPKVTFVLDPSTNEILELEVVRLLRNVPGVLSATEHVILLPNPITDRKFIEFIPEDPDPQNHSVLLINYENQTAEGIIFKKFDEDNVSICYRDDYIIDGEFIMRDNTAENILAKIIEGRISQTQTILHYYRDEPRLLPFRSTFTNTGLEVTCSFDKFEIETAVKPLTLQDMQKHLKNISIRSYEFNFSNIDLSEVTVSARNNRKGFEVEFNVPAGSSGFPLTAVLTLTPDLRIVKSELHTIEL